MIRWSPATPARPGCPHRRLTRLLAAELGGGIAIGASTLRPWASANFVGARHLFACAGNEAAKALQERLIATEWRLPGHIVADVAIEPGDGAGFTIEILTVED
ncbi:hypothetical protein [Sphingopyxis lindanitolerans]|uniref:hypothetical protein n=1 Tax=Sphingopyxis lindanitolerans TaxID=2054227 RepID=UPI001F5BDAB3|nr:hypothetical protein [Sphingopyxis lindanitolerans]